MITARHELQPGVYLNLVQTDRFKTGCFSINFLTPLQAETASVHALLPSILLRGCRNWPDMQSISHHLDDLYGGSVGTLVRKKGEIQSVGLYADFLEDRYAESMPVFDRMMDFVGQLLFDPCPGPQGFVEDYVAGERINLINTLESRINDKRSYAVSRLLKHMCDGEAYAVPRLGDVPQLEAASTAQIRDCWQGLQKTAPLELFYLGQQPEAQVLAAMERLLAGLPERQPRSLPETQILLPDRPVREIAEAMDVTQGKLSMGLRTPITVQDPRYPALLLLNAVFGGSMTSKLFLKIREEQSLCYYANSSVDKFKGLMIIGSGIEFANYQIAKEGILEQLAQCQAGTITGQELEDARNHLISALRTGNDSPGRLDDFAIGQAVAGMTGTMADLAAALRQVTLEQVVEAAASLTLDTIYFLKGVEA